MCSYFSCQIGLLLFLTIVNEFPISNFCCHFDKLTAINAFHFLNLFFIYDRIYSFYDLNSHNFEHFICF